MMVYISQASAATSLADQAESSVIFAAVSWLEATLLGTIATTIAVIAIASIGIMMLTGRVNVRRGVTVVCGCFILVGAPAIAGLQSSLTHFGGSAAPPAAEAPVVPPPPVVPAAAQYDPYAGASVPVQ